MASEIQCSWCGQIKPLRDFTLKDGTIDERQCKACRKKWTEEFRQIAKDSLAQELTERFTEAVLGRRTNAPHIAEVAAAVFAVLGGTTVACERMGDRLAEILEGGTNKDALSAVRAITKLSELATQHQDTASDAIYLGDEEFQAAVRAAMVQALRDQDRDDVPKELSQDDNP